MRTTICFTIPGMDLFAEIDFHVTYKGSRGTHFDPPEAPDFEVNSISVYEDDQKGLHRPVNLPEIALDAIAESDEAYTVMLDYYSVNGDDA